MGFGSNLGDRLALLRAAARHLALATHVEKTSRVYVTAPVGDVDQPEFLNAAALVEYEGTLEELLDLLLTIEQKLGRVRREKWGPRVIDLDLLWADGVVSETGRLTVPHPRLRDRAFAMIPLLELVPNATDPRTGERYRMPAGGVQPTREVL